MRVKVSVSGLREVAAGLEDLAKSTQRGVLTRVLKRAAQPVEGAAKSMAPQPGKNRYATGKLLASIGTIVLRGNPGKAAFAKSMQGGSSREEAAAAAKAANARAAGRGASATVRVKASAPHAHLIEDGTQKMAAQPFMGPALRQQRDGVIESIKADLANEIEKTAKRAAARAAKRKA